MRGPDRAPLADEPQLIIVKKIRKWVNIPIDTDSQEFRLAGA